MNVCVRDLRELLLISGGVYSCYQRNVNAIVTTSYNESLLDKVQADKRVITACDLTTCGLGHLSTPRLVWPRSSSFGKWLPVDEHASVGGTTPALEN